MLAAPSLAALLLLLAPPAPSSAWTAPGPGAVGPSPPRLRPPPLASSTRPSSPSLSSSSSSSSSSSETRCPERPWSSAYDPALPPALVGEAVRSALRSDRGVCLDLSTDRYAADDDASGEGSSRLVSVVSLRGAGTADFLRAKFSGSAPDAVDDGGGGGGGSGPTTELVRRGRAYETGYLTPKGRIVDRLLVLEFPGGGDDDDAGAAAEDAFLITSPGNGGATLHDELSPRVFPMDRTELTARDPGPTRVLTLACASLRDARTSFMNNLADLLLLGEGGSSAGGGFDFPPAGTCHHYRVAGGGAGGHPPTDVYLTEHAFLSPEVCRGYTLLFREEAGGSGDADAPTLADRAWDRLVDEGNDRGPVGIGAREYETLRVEAGLPGYGAEMTGDGAKKGAKVRGGGGEAGGGEGAVDDDDAYRAKAGPLELHLGRLIDVEKGCYLGQEGVASALKNKRGPPRQLYQAVFLDSENGFGDDDDDDRGGGYDGLGLWSIDDSELRAFRRKKGQADPIANDARQPRPGDDVYVLGSNESIVVGKITSVAEPNGTGAAKTVALALAKRPGPILKAVREQGLDLPRWWEDAEADGEGGAGSGPGMPGKEAGGSGILRPPPLDPLHNLEIVIGGTYTVGRLVSVPGRRYLGASRGDGDVATLLDYEGRGEVTDVAGPAYFKYEPEGAANGAPPSPVVEPESQRFDADGEDGGMDDDEGITDDLLAKAEEEAAQAAAAAEAAAAEAKRKEEKMKLLKARAEAAMAARRKKKESAETEVAEAKRKEEDAAAAEAKRKEEKMKLLKARAEAAMAARRKKRQSS